MKETFPIIPAATGTLWFVAGLAAMLCGVIVLFIWIAWGTQYTLFEVSADGLAIRGDLYGRTVPWTHLMPEKARIVNLEKERELRPKLRTNGTGMPGYAAGWFGLANGEKALLFLTSRKQAVYVPTTEGYSLLLSPKQPQALLAALHERR